MKQIRTYILALGIGCLAGLTSCSDSWLDTTSTQTVEGDDLLVLHQMLVWRLMVFAVSWFNSTAIMDSHLMVKVQ